MNKKRYWLRGGVLALIVLIIASVVGYRLSFGTGCGILCGVGLIYPWYPAIIIVNQIVGNFSMSLVAFVSTIILGIILWFCAGGIVGLIYGNIKKRASSQLSPSVLNAGG